jgi:hypothetical protein
MPLHMTVNGTRLLHHQNALATCSIERDKPASRIALDLPAQWRTAHRCTRDIRKDGTTHFGPFSETTTGPQPCRGVQGSEAPPYQKRPHGNRQTSTAYRIHSVQIRRDPVLPPVQADPATKTVDQLHSYYKPTGSPGPGSAACTPIC